MDLERLNDSYTKLKEKIEKSTEKIENFEEKFTTYSDNKKLLEADLIMAKRSGDKDRESQCQEEIKNITKNIIELREIILEEQNNIKGFKEAIDRRIEAIKENPEMKKHLESVMATKYERKIEKTKQEKEELIGKGEKLEKIKVLMKDHPTIANNMKGMISAQEEINKLNEELENLVQTREPMISYKDPVKAQEIIDNLLPQAEGKYNKNKDSFMSFVEKNKIGLEEKDIKELAKGDIIRDKDGNIELDKMVDKKIKPIKRQIKGKDKQIRNYEIALGDASISREESTNEEEPDHTVDHEDHTPDTPDTPDSSDTSTKPSWWRHPIKRIQYWWKSINTEQLPEPEPEQEQEPEQEVEDIDVNYRNKKENPYKDSLKYEIIKDLTEKIETEDLKEASKERRQEERRERESDDGR